MSQHTMDVLLDRLGICGVSHGQERKHIAFGNLPQEVAHAWPQLDVIWNAFDDADVRRRDVRDVFGAVQQGLINVQHQKQAPTFQ